MEASKEILSKVAEYQAVKLKAEQLRKEIKGLLEKEYLEKTGLALNIGTFEPFVSDIARGKKESETGTYCKEKPVGYKRLSKYWYVGEEFVPVENSDKFIGFEYER